MTLWALGFILDGVLGVENQVVKWLDTPVREYLLNGSPVMDYTRKLDCFIKTKQGDIDVGQHFNNARAYPVNRPPLGL